MPFSLRKLTLLQGLAFCVLLLFGFTVLAVNAGRWWSTTTVATAQGQGTPMPVAAADDPPPLIVLRMVLRPEGFEMPEVTIPKGKVRLILLNRTGLADLALQFSKVVGNKEKLKDVKFDLQNRFQVEDTFDLSPGDYLVEVTAHPEWVGHVTVTNK